MAAWIKGHFKHKMADIKEMMRHGSSGQINEDYTITFTPKDSAAETGGEVNEEGNVNE